ncbi:MAG: ScyD/ScyE family protein [Vicinamibacterales bacterium]
MLPTRISSRLSLAISALVGVVALGVPSALWAQPPLQVIASGLDNPRGLEFGPDGALYVVEAGRGGNSTLCGQTPDAPPGTLRCYGATGAITRVTGLGVHQRVVTGLPSLAGATGVEATGPHDIDFGFGNAWVTIGFGGDPATRTAFAAAGVRFGNLVRVRPTGAWDYVLDLAAFEATANPDGGLVDSNPYGLQILANRGVFTDAGGNALMGITTSGAISTLAVFPTRTMPSPFGGTVPMQSVPTTLVEAADGSLFVGELTGFPFPAGGARVYRVPANGGAPVVVASGFTNIIDIAVSPTGVGYVLEHDADGILPPVGPGMAGRVIRVLPNGTQTVIASTGLVKPGGIAIGPDGALYVTNRSTSAGSGEVVRIVP